MRRAITLIMVLGIVIAGAAAETIQVNYELDTSDLEEIKVVFTTAPVDNVNDAKSAMNGTPVTLSAEQGATEATYGTGDDGLYLVWYAYTANNVKVTLGIGPMATTDSEGSSKFYLPWTVTVNNSYQTTEKKGTALPASQSSGSNDDKVTGEKNISTEANPDAAAAAIDVVSVDKTSTMKQTWGNKSISAKATLTDAVAGIYSGTITATISATT